MRVQRGGAVAVLSALKTVSDFSRGNGRAQDSVWRNASVDKIYSVCGRARGLAATRKLEEGRQKDLSLLETEELFDFMRANDGYLEVEVVVFLLRHLFQCHEADVDQVRLLLEENSEDGCILARSFHAIVSRGPGCDAIATLHDRVQPEGSHQSASVVKVDRELFMDRIAWRVDRDEALSTLPFTIFYLVIFICLVMFHLEIWERQQLERGIQSWVSGYGASVDGPYLQKHVKHVDSFYSWLEASGLPALLNNTRNGSRGLSCYLAVSSVLIGDVQVKQTQIDGTSESAWLLHSEAGAARLASHPGDLGAAAIYAFSVFQQLGLSTRHTQSVEVAFSTYEEERRKFALTRVSLLVGKYGKVSTLASTTALAYDAYPQPVLGYTLDVIYLLLIFHVTRRELWEMYHSGRSCANFVSYWSVWNVIDWVSIILGMVSCGLWVSCVFAMDADVLRRIMDEDDPWRLRGGIMDVSEHELDRLMEGLDYLRARFIALHVVVAANSISIVMRSFKGFEANARLSTVAQTFQRCYQDIVHFLIVFVVMFLCMAIIGHVLFGCDLRQFKTINTSINTCFMVLMGDFDWYVALTDTPNFLPSGIPRVLMAVWFFCYTFFVSIVLINMLLAIILEKYGEVENEVLNGNPKTVWQQTARFVCRLRDTRGFIPLPVIRSKLQDGNDPAHPAFTVTEASLQEAFRGMTAKQAAWLMRWLHAEAFVETGRDRDPQDLTRLKRTSRLLKYATEQLGELAESALSNDGRLQELELRLLQATSKTASQEQAGTLHVSRPASVWAQRSEGVYRSMAVSLSPEPGGEDASPQHSFSIDL